MAHLCFLISLKWLNSIPHSNAQEERVFSIIRKKTVSLDPKGTLLSILTIKLAASGQVH